MHADGSGGDNDVPYRERQTEKDARAQREAQTGRGAWSGGNDLDDAQPARAILEADRNGDYEDADGYYSNVQKQNENRRRARRSWRTRLSRLRASPLSWCPASPPAPFDFIALTQVEVDDDGAEGPRSLTRVFPGIHTQVKERTQSKGEEASEVCKGKERRPRHRNLCSRPGAGDYSTWVRQRAKGVSQLL